MQRPSLPAKAALASHGITETRVASLYGSSQAFVSYVLNGHKRAPARFRKLVAELTGAPEADLFPDFCMCGRPR